MSSTARSIRRAEERRRRKETRKRVKEAERKQLRAQVNQQNAQASTGPRTEEGKAVSSQNARRHGLTGTFCVLPHESQDDFELLIARLFVEHDPQDATEELLVSDMARHYWLTQRALRLQEELMLQDMSDPNVQRQFALFLRYQTTNQRAFHKCLSEIQKINKLRQLEEDRFVSQFDKAVKQKRDGFVSQNAKSGAIGFVPQNPAPETNGKEPNFSSV